MGWESGKGDPGGQGIGIRGARDQGCQGLYLYLVYVYVYIVGRKLSY